MQETDQRVASKKETLAALQQFQKTDEGPLRLLEHALWESRALYWRTGTGKMSRSAGAAAALAEGSSPQDVVQEALTLTIDGHRPWNDKKYPNIFNHLKWVVTSLTKNLGSSSDNKRLRAMPENEDGKLREDLLPAEGPGAMASREFTAVEEVEEAEPEVVETEPGQAEPPEARVLRLTDSASAAELDNKVFEAIKDDDQLLRVYEGLMEGGKPRDIKKKMGLSDKEMYRLTQKLRRRVGPVFGR